MIKVWILVALVNNGHMSWNMVPTMEFTSRLACEKVIRVLEKEASDRTVGRFSGFCTEIEK
jgi:hypothetical protein